MVCAFVGECIGGGQAKHNFFQLLNCTINTMCFFLLYAEIIQK